MSAADQDVAASAGAATQGLSVAAAAGGAAGAAHASGSASAAAAPLRGPHAPRTPAEWRAQICSLQTARMTPQLRADMEQRQQRASVAMSCAVRAAGVQGASNRVYNGFSMGVVSLGASAAAGALGGGAAAGHAQAASAPAAAAMLERAMARAAPQAKRALASASASARDCAPSAAAAPASALQAESQQLRMAFCDAAQSEMDASEEAGEAAQASAMAALSVRMRCGTGGGGGGGAALPLPAYEAVAPLAVAPAHGGAGGVDGALADAMEGLRAEPASDADLAAGFAVFSSYLDKVVGIRGQALGVYADAGALLPEEGRAALRASVAVLDDPANLAVADPPPGQWIVYGMARKASANHGVIAALVHSLECKLALLQTAVDCPFCMERVGEGGRAAHVVPACCHRACSDCWENWAQVCATQGRAAFCPLCRGPAELMAVLSPDA